MSAFFISLKPGINYPVLARSFLGLGMWQLCVFACRQVLGLKLKNKVLKDVWEPRGSSAAAVPYHLQQAPRRGPCCAGTSFTQEVKTLPGYQSCAGSPPHHHLASPAVASESDSYRLLMDWKVDRLVSWLINCLIITVYTERLQRAQRAVWGQAPPTPPPLSTWKACGQDTFYFDLVSISLEKGGEKWRVVTLVLCRAKWERGEAKRRGQGCTETPAKPESIVISPRLLCRALIRRRPWFLLKPSIFKFLHLIISISYNILSLFPVSHSVTPSLWSQSHNTSIHQEQHYFGSGTRCVSKTALLS